MVEDKPSKALLTLLEGGLSSASKFAALAKDSEKTGIAPRQSDPAVRTLLDRLLDTPRLGTAANYRIEDIAVLNGWSRAVERVANTYLRAGTITAADPDDKVRLIDQNVVRFAPEIGRCLDALLRLQTLTADVIAAILASESCADRHNLLVLDTGWIETRFWLSKIMKTTLCFLVIDNLPEGWARDRIAVLAEVASRAMRHMTDGDVDLLHTFAKGATSRLQDPTARAALASIGSLRQI